MPAHRVTRLYPLMVAGLVSCLPTRGGLLAQQPPPPPPQPQPSGVEVLTRGPVHEAFAETIDDDPGPGLEVNVAPPEPIEEIPPDQRPEGENVAWVPGYWAWDDERNDFIWISGIWRSLPPGRQWVPGYWSPSGPGYRWTPGYWLDAEVTEVEYLPPPPQTVEIGANIAAPSPDHVWVPGCWVWYEGRYAWRPGYWVQLQPDWVWVPAHYVWAPRGYVFIEGYWDYDVVDRGVLFAPTYVEPAVRVQTAFVYSPSIVIDLDIFTDHLFVRPSYCHYYFGDYYEARYTSVGFYASFTWHDDYCYEPIYAHRHWRHRADRDWSVRVRADFERRREHVEYRPPRTYSAQVEIARREAVPRDRSLAVAASLDVYAKRTEAKTRYRRVEPEEKQRINVKDQEFKRYRQERRERERPEAVAERPKDVKPDRPDRPDQPVARDKPSRVKVSRSPITGPSKDATVRGRTVPKRAEAPRPDTKVEPKPRKQGDRPAQRAKRGKKP